MKTIKNTYTNEIIINKSRFITSVYRINSLDEAEEILKATRKKYYDATHNCFAYIIGKNADIQKCSDDGEPSKTAGFPILDVLKKKEITNVLCIVTRYFGGILLGAGGLVRAYSQSAADVFKDAEFYESKKFSRLEIRLDYSSYNQVLTKLSSYSILDTFFTSDVLIVLGISPDNIKELTDYLNSVTSGNVQITDKGIYELEIKI